MLKRNCARCQGKMAFKKRVHGLLTGNRAMCLLMLLNCNIEEKFFI